MDASVTGDRGSSFGVVIRDENGDVVGTRHVFLKVGRDIKVTKAGVASLDLHLARQIGL